MIPIQTLKYLIKNKLKDADILFKSNRYSSSIYLAGYAVEISLKYKICLTFQFNQGFPETKQELHNYQQQLNKALPALLTVNIGQIKNHNLSSLLTYSGIELLIKRDYLAEWITVNTWNTEDRYKKKRILKSNTQSFLIASKKIIKQII